MPSITFIGPVALDIFLFKVSHGRQNMVLETKTNTHIQSIYAVV